MRSFPIHTIDSAPADSRDSLSVLQEAFGMIPNIAGAMANSSVLIGSLVGIFQRVHGGSLTEPQIQCVLLTDAVTNASEWAVAFHTALGLHAGLEMADVAAIRDARLPRDGKLAALSSLARDLIEKRGHLDDRTVESFVAAGFRKDQLLEVIAIVAASTITNYTATITQPPLESAFQNHAWQAPSAERSD